MGSNRDTPINQLGFTLGFFASVIKSGETWTNTCEEEYKKAESALSLIRASMNGGSTWRLIDFPKHCPFCGHDPKVTVVFQNPNWMLTVYCETDKCRIHNVGMTISEWNQRPERIIPGW